MYNPKLFTAITGGQLKQVETLLEEGNDPNERNADGFAPLHLTCIYPDVDIIKILLKKGARIDNRCNAGRTALHMLSTFPNDKTFDCINTLISNGANVNEQDSYGRIPLHYAAQWRSINTVKLLIDEGSSVTMMDNYNITPYDFAKSSHEENPGSPDRLEIKNYIEKIYKKEILINLLLCIRTFSEDSVFYKDSLPLDLFKTVMVFVLKFS